jgi:hypothetical protein
MHWGKKKGPVAGPFARSVGDSVWQVEFRLSVAF